MKLELVFYKIYFPLTADFMRLTEELFLQKKNRRKANNK